MKNFFRISLFIWGIMLFPGTGIYAQSASEDIIHLSRIEEGLKAPVRMALDRSDNFYVTDANLKAILKYDASGNLLETIKPGGEPHSLAVNSENQLFFGDAETGTIYRLNADGSKSVFYSGLQYPNSMVFDADGLLYVVDSESNTVAVIDISANLVRNIGEGIFLYPTGIAYNKINNRLLVAEHGGLGTGFSPAVKVWMFDPDGTLLGSFGSYGNGDGQFYRIQGMCIGRCGNIYVSDPYQGEISIFDEAGGFITKFGEFGDSLSQLNVPMDIVYDSQDRVMVSSLNNGALEIFSIADTLPSARIESLNSSICSGETVDIEIAFTGTAPWTFSYTVDGLDTTLVSNTVDNPYILTVSQPGTYEIVELSDAAYAGTCFTGNTSITVNSELPTSNISSGDIAICEGETTNIVIDFTGSSPWTFTYTKDGLDPVSITTTNNPYLLNVSDSGLYEVSTLEGGGCVGNILTGSASVTVNTLPTSYITEGNAQIHACTGETVELNIELTGKELWNIVYMVDEENPVLIENILTSPFILQATITGTYEVKELYDANCVNLKSDGFPEVVFHENPIPGYSYNSNALEVSFSNTSLNADSYFWDFGDGTTSEETNPVQEFQAAGEYIVSLTSGNMGCSDVSYTDTIVVLETGVELSRLEDYIQLYPNPTQGMFTIELNNSLRSDFRVEIINLSGQIIYSVKFNSQESRRTLDLSSFPEGLYLVKLISNDFIKLGKLVISD